MERATVAALYRAAADSENAALRVDAGLDDQELTPREAQAIRSYTARLNDLASLMRNLACRAEGRKGG